MIYFNNNYKTNSELLIKLTINKQYKFNQKIVIL